MVVMVDPTTEMGIRWDIPVKIETGNKEMDMVKGMVMGIKINKEGPKEGLLLLQVGQPGQAGRDGQAPQLTKALEDALKTQKTS